MEQSTSTSVKSKTKAFPSICKICGGPALYSYYGVISCYACKIFFRRHAQNPQSLLKCDSDDQCEINLTNRHICGACRLEKCFENGMRADLIRSAIPKKIPRITLSGTDHLLLNNNESTLLANLIDSYDQSKLLEIIQQFKNEHSQSQPINLILVKDLISNFYQTAGIYLRSNKDILNLPSNDRSVLIHTAADNVTCLGATFVSFHSQLMNNQVFSDYLETVYGKDTIEYYQWLMKFIESDSTIFKLALGLFSFSSNSRIFHRNISSMEFNNIKTILEIENKYAELTWKYLIHKYSYDQAIKTFANLNQWFLTVTALMSYAHNHQAHRNDIQELVEQTELIFILDDDEQINQTT